jgi:hypothetical protein
VKWRKSSEPIGGDNQVIERGFSEIRYGNQQLALRLRQGAKHRDNLFEAHTRNEPRDLLGIHDIKQQLGHNERHTVGGFRGFKLIFERQQVATNRPLVREVLCPGLFCITLREIRTRHIEKARVGTLGLAAPVIERGDRVHPLRNARAVEINLALLVHDDVTPADLRLEALDLGAQSAVGLEEFTLDARTLAVTRIRSARSPA